MGDLSAEARALLARVSPSDEPSRADRDRVLGMIGGALAIPTAPTPGGAAAGTGAVATGGALKLVLAFVHTNEVDEIVTAECVPNPSPVTFL